MNLLHRLWAWVGQLPSPVSPDLPITPAPLTPAGEAREPVGDQDADAAAACVAMQRRVMDALCLQANAYVYRDYGAGEVVDFDRPIHLDESAQLEIARYAANR